MHELAGFAVFHQPPAFKRYDPVRLPQSGESVSDYENRTPRADPPHILVDNTLALLIERARCFIEDQNARIVNEGSGNGDALALAAGKQRPAFTDRRFISIRQIDNEVVRAGKLRRGDDPLHRHGGIDQRNVLAHRPVEQQSSCSTTPICRRSHETSTVAISVPSIRTRPPSQM